MNARKVLYQLFALVMIAAMLVSCAPKPAPTAVVTEAAPAATEAPASAEVDPTVGRVLYNVGFLKGHPVIRLMTLGFVIGCEELGYEYKLLLTDGSDMAQLSGSYEQAIAEKASGIVSFAHDPALKPVIDRAGKAGIPVVSAHFPQPEGEYPGLTAWVAADTVRYATDVAMSMGAELRKRGKTGGTVAVTEGSFNSVENTVAETFTSVMNKEFPEFKILPAQEEGFDPPVAIAKAAAIIGANPDMVGAMSTTGAGPTTWARAAEETGFKDGDIVIISMDYTRPNLDLVKAGKVYGLVGQPLFQEFREAVYILDKLFRGEPFEYANPMVAPIITLADLDTYYKLNDDVEAKLGAGANAAATPVPDPTEGKVLYNVGFLKGHPVIRLMTLGFVIGCEELGYEYKLLLTDGSDMAQLSGSYEQAIAENASGIVSFAHDPALKPVIDRAGKAGIPVVSAHFPQPEGEYPGLTAWVAADTVRYATDVAMSMGAELRKRGKTGGTVAVTEGSFNSVENTVAETFTSVMNKEFPEFKILPAQEEGFDPPVAIAKAAAIIGANPDMVGAMSTTGAGPTTWARAAEETGFKDGDIVIISMDYTRPNLDLVKAGKVYGLVGQPLFQEFREAVYILDKLFRGEPFEYANPMVAPIITLADLDTYYKLNDDVEAKLGAGANAAATATP